MLQSNRKGRTLDLLCFSRLQMVPGFKDFVLLVNKNQARGMKKAFSKVSHA